MAHANLTEEDKAELIRLIKAARYDVERSDRLTKRAKGILTKAMYLVQDGPRQDEPKLFESSEDILESQPEAEEDIPSEIADVLPTEE